MQGRSHTFGFCVEAGSAGDSCVTVPACGAMRMVMHSVLEDTPVTQEGAAVTQQSSRLLH